jgi:type VI secretion system protein ImpE
MGPMQSDLDLFKQGLTAEAIEAITQRVKSDQSDVEARSRLIEYLCVSSQFERADRQLEVIMSMDPKTVVRVAELRQLIRAGIARNDMWTNGRAPEFTATPPEHVNLRLQALVSFREGNLSDCADFLQQAEGARPNVRGRVGGAEFEDFRDIDDFFGGVLEIFTSTGKYFWVPVESVEEANFAPLSRPLDTAWREVELTVKDGPSGVVYMPALYPQFNEIVSVNDQVNGLTTEWVETEGGIFRGHGLRCFMVGETNLSIHEIDNFSIG